MSKHLRLDQSNFGSVGLIALFSLAIKNSISHKNQIKLFIFLSHSLISHQMSSKSSSDQIPICPMWVGVRVRVRVGVGGRGRRGVAMGYLKFILQLMGLDR